jgi:hypothetical protein
MTGKVTENSMKQMKLTSATCYNIKKTSRIRGNFSGCKQCSTLVDIMTLPFQLCLLELQLIVITNNPIIKQLHA